MPHPSGRPWIVAHRGASAARRENTIDAFTHAAELGADAVELDVRRTADGALVVHHDALLPESERPIIEMKLAEIRERAPHIPLFEEAVAACRGMWMDVEIKNAPFDPDWDPEDRTLEALIPLLPESALVTSFNAPTVMRARDRRLRSGWLLPRAVDPLDALQSWAGHEFILPSVEALAGERAARLAQAAAHRGVEVGVWTVDDPAEMARLAGTGVGTICTNVPDVALAALSPTAG